MSSRGAQPGRNDPCPCGSGQKFKRCCGAKPVASLAPAVSDPRAIGELVALVEQDRLDEAERRVSALLATQPNVGMLWKILGVTLMRQGKDAIAALTRTVALMPRDAEAHRNLGAALHDRGRWAESLASLDRARALAPLDVDSQLDAADAMRGLGRARDSIPLYQDVLRRDPQRAEAQNNLGNAYLEVGKHSEAERCYRLALSRRPDDAQILGNLANALRQLGRLDEALAIGRQSIAVNPDLSVAHNIVGLTLAALGRREEAVANFREAIARAPDFVDAHNNLGSVLRELGERSEAVAVCRRAIAIDPRNADSHCNLGTVLFELRRIDEAAACFQAALALRPDFARAHLSLGLVLRQLRRPVEAEASCQAALRVDANYMEALSLLGELRADRGEFQQAEALFWRAIEINPGSSFAYASIATHRKMTSADSHWLKGAEALLNRTLPLDQSISLNYALGKYYDDVGRFDDAFGRYRAANELGKRLGPAYDNAEFARRVDQLIRRVDAPFLHACRAVSSASALPVFIVGMPRSGTSLAEQILASHPAVIGAGELTYWHAAVNALGGDDLERALDAQCVRAMGEEYLERVTALAGRALRVVDKMPANFLYAGLIHALFPEARIIHMQRDPIDTCLSIYFQNFFNMGRYKNDLRDLAQYYGEYRRIAAHWRALLPAAALLEVPYEGLIDDQEGWTRRMVAFVGLPWDARCLAFHETERVVITASKWQVRQKISRASIGRWRNYEHHVGPLRELIGDGAET